MSAYVPAIPLRYAVNFYRLYCGPTGICSVHVDFPVFNSRDPAGHLTQILDNQYIGQASACRHHVQPASERCLGGARTRLANIWIVWVIQNLAWRPPDVCGFIGDQFAGSRLLIH